MKTSILLADDHDIVREGLKILLDKEPGFSVVALAADGREAIAYALRCVPDIAILDVAMPGLNGIEACRAIHAKVPATRILALSMHTESKFVVTMIRSGARGYILKDSAFSELVTAVHELRNGRLYLSAALCDDLLELISQTNPPEKQTDVLTPREREILQLISEAFSSKQIAFRLNLSIKTIETHRSNIMKKLKTHSLSELTQIAIYDGLTTLN